jgi:carboxyvinyl-carboxyphosphonate phosphorylmutase
MVMGANIGVNRMKLMNQRIDLLNFREALAKPACISPASVYDPLSARIAESVGYRIAMLAGSIASFTTLAAPDVLVMTLTEVSEQVRRITRTSNLGLLVDADLGYGNALNVMRTVEELEHAGAAAISIEDTLLPQQFGQSAGAETVISIEEMMGKLRAAVAARRNREFVIAGRTSSLRVEGLGGAVRRVKCYAEAGVDAIFAIGVEHMDQIKALRAASGLPLIIGPAPKSSPFDRTELSACGVALLLQGHQPIAAAVKILRETYSHLYAGGRPEDIAEKVAGSSEMDELVRVKEFSGWRREFL